MTTSRPKAEAVLQVENDRVKITEWRFTSYRPIGVEHNVVNANDYPFSFDEIEMKEGLSQA